MITARRLRKPINLLFEGGLTYSIQLVLSIDGAAILSDQLIENAPTHQRLKKNKC